MRETLGSPLLELSGWSYINQRQAFVPSKHQLLWRQEPDILLPQDVRYDLRMHRYRCLAIAKLAEVVNHKPCECLLWQQKPTGT